MKYIGMILLSISVLFPSYSNNYSPVKIDGNFGNEVNSNKFIYIDEANFLYYGALIDTNFNVVVKTYNDSYSININSAYKTNYGDLIIFGTEFYKFPEEPCCRCDPYPTPIRLLKVKPNGDINDIMDSTWIYSKDHPISTIYNPATNKTDILVQDDSAFIIYNTDTIRSSKIKIDTLISFDKISQIAYLPGPNKHILKADSIIILYDFINNKLIKSRKAFYDKIFEADSSYFLAYNNGSMFRLDTNLNVVNNYLTSNKIPSPSRIDVYDRRVVISDYKYVLELDSALNLISYIKIPVRNGHRIVDVLVQRNGIVVLYSQQVSPYESFLKRFSKNELEVSDTVNISLQKVNVLSFKYQAKKTMYYGQSGIESFNYTLVAKVVLKNNGHEAVQNIVLSTFQNITIAGLNLAPSDSVIYQLPEISSSIGFGPLGACDYDGSYHYPLSYDFSICLAVKAPKDKFNTSLKTSACSESYLVTSIEGESIDYQLEIFPNPVIEKLFLRQQYEAQFKYISISIFDILGNKVSERVMDNAANLEINTENLPEGIYILKVRLDDNRIKYSKFIKGMSKYE